VRERFVGKDAPIVQAVEITVQFAEPVDRYAGSFVEERVRFGITTLIGESKSNGTFPPNWTRAEVSTFEYPLGRVPESEESFTTGESTPSQPAGANIVMSPGITTFMLDDPVLTISVPAGATSSFTAVVTVTVEDQTETEERSTGVVILAVVTPVLEERDVKRDESDDPVPERSIEVPNMLVSETPTVVTVVRSPVEVRPVPEIVAATIHPSAVATPSVQTVPEIPVPELADSFPVLRLPVTSDAYEVINIVETANIMEVAAIARMFFCIVADMVK
jgi:hypothetical protein